MKKLISATVAAIVVISTGPMDVTAQAMTLPKVKVTEKLATTTGVINGVAKPYAYVYAYNKGKLIGGDKADKHGKFHISIKPQKFKSIVQLVQVKNNVKSDKIGLRIVKNYQLVPQKSVKQINDRAKSRINKAMFSYMDKVTKTQKKAVTDYYFGHGASGYTDWFGFTPHGEIQVQEQNNPGYYSYPLHAVGGFIVYTPKSGVYGIEKDHYKDIYVYNSVISSFKDNTQAVKYILADNGKVYEMNGYTTDSKGRLLINPTTGFAEDAKYDKPHGLKFAGFKATTSKALQNEYSKVFNKYVK